MWQAKAVACAEVQGLAGQGPVRSWGRLRWSEGREQAPGTGVGHGAPAVFQVQWKSLWGSEQSSDVICLVFQETHWLLC